MSWFLLSLSVLLNVFLIWYVVQLLKRLLSIQDELDEFLLSLDEYSSHIEMVYGLERFYGDDILKNLLNHSKGFNKRINYLRSLYDMDYEEYEEEEDDDTETKN